MRNPEQVIDVNGGPPFNQHQNFEVRSLLSPATPAKNIQTRRQKNSIPNYSQMNQASQPNCLDPLSGIYTANPQWSPTFPNGFCSAPGLPDLLQDFNGGQTVPACTNQAIMGSFMPYASTVSCGNAGLMNQCSPKLSGNAVPAINAVGNHKMPYLSRLVGNNTNSHLMPPANQLPLNEKVLLQQSCCNINSDWVDLKYQYGSQVPYIPDLNSFLDSTMNIAGSGAISSFRSHVFPEKHSQRMLDKQALEVICLANETAREKNVRMREVLAEASFSSMIASSEYSQFQSPDCLKDLALSDGVSYQLAGLNNSLVEGDNENLDLNDTSKLKPKRKKHRPKVIFEGKPARTPKSRTPIPKTPTPTQDKENCSGKRKYIRRKDTTPCLDSTSSVGKVVDTESRNESKSVRRTLNFDEEESHSFLMPMLKQNLECHTLGSKVCNLEGSRLKDTADFDMVRGPIVENSLEGIVIDLKNSGNILPNEHLKILLSSVPSSKINQNVGASKSISNGYSISTSPCKGTKREHSVDEILWMKEKKVSTSYNVRSFSSKSFDAKKRGASHPDMNKRMRMENDGNTACQSSPNLTYNPSSGWTIMQAQNNSQVFAFTDAEKFMAQAQLQRFERMLLFGKADENIINYHVLRNNLRSLNGMMNFGRNSAAARPSVQMNNDISQPQTPNKPSGYSNSQESNICGAVVQHNTFEDANKPMKAKVRKTKKRRGECTSVNHYSSPANIRASHCNYPPHASHHEVVLFKGQDSRNYETLANTSIPGDINSMDFIAYKLRKLCISCDNQTANFHAQNAIVPYVMKGGVLVAYKGNFELIKRRRLRAKVDLDPETDRVWKLLMGIEGEFNETASMDKEMWWEEERRIFRGRADSFIARMHLVQGDRRFSQWKGSVVDSVIGVFLTQNVSDHLSSSAFMSLAAKFPLHSEENSAIIIKKIDGTRENHIESSISFIGTPHFQRNISDHDFYSQAHSEITSTKNEGKKESSSDETFGSSTGSSGVVYFEEKCLESHETEINFGQESPNSGSITAAVTVARSINSAENEDKRLVEEVVSSQNSGILSQSSIGCQPHSSDYARSNAHKEDFQTENTNNGFEHSSFTELLHIAESNKFRELYCNGSIQKANGQTILQTKNSFPLSNHLGNSEGAYQSCNTEFTTHHTLFGMPDMIPEPPFFYSLNPNLTILENNGNTVKGQIGSLHQNIYKVVESNKFEVNDAFSREPAAEHLTASKCEAATINDSYVPMRISCEGQPIILETESLGDIKVADRADSSSNTINFDECFHVRAGDMSQFQQKDDPSVFTVDALQEINKVQSRTEIIAHAKTNSTSNNKVQISFDMDQTVGLNLKDGTFDFQKAISEQPKHELKVKKRKAESEKKTFDWDSLRKEVNCSKPTEGRNPDTMDSLDWEAVRCADVSEIAEAIRERGMNNMLAERIKDFLNRLVREHGSIDLEWLRSVPPDKSKDFLLSIRGLGLKSAECVRLLTLHHLAFPVDTNVGRICVRLGWVPLQPLPESLQLHLLELYPVLETIQKYLWPRLCKIDQRTLYELHYQMITFGKVFCTKSRPNCNACPMRGECRHFASAFASARLALPAPDDKSIVNSTHPIGSQKEMAPACALTSIQQLECNLLTQDLIISKNCEPIVEEPSTPEPECQKTLESEIEDAFFEDPDEIPTIKLNFEKFTQNLQNYMQENMELQAADMSKALVALTPEAASIPMPKLKNISRLRTEHQVYEIPDSHPLLEGLDQREPDDPCPYLLAIWAPGETAQSTESPEACCSCHDPGQLCDASACFTCNSIKESQAQNIRGTLLIPCRTAMRGSFPLNGTYFQVNEVFADHHTSRTPIDIPRDWIWNLNRRTVCFGTSIPTIFRGLTTEGIQHCFWRGFVCVRGFDRATRAPKPLYARLHFPASKALKNKKGGAAAAAAAEVGDLAKNTIETQLSSIMT